MIILFGIVSDDISSILFVNSVAISFMLFSVLMIKLGFIWCKKKVHGYKLFIAILQQRLYWGIGKKKKVLSESIIVHSIQISQLTVSCYSI